MLKSLRNQSTCRFRSKICAIHISELKIEFTRGCYEGMLCIEKQPSPVRLNGRIPQRLIYNPVWLSFSEGVIKTDFSAQTAKNKYRMKAVNKLQKMAGNFCIFGEAVLGEIVQKLSMFKSPT